MFIRIRGQRHYLWRAVDQHGRVLDILVQSRRNTKAAKRFFFKKLLKERCQLDGQQVSPPAAGLESRLFRQRKSDR